ncbi:MAG: DNA alkylation repair protein [Flavobacteriales bacterium]|nr:DNA alkylation repair protein [Flavobacteriales bacterium]
MEAEIVNRKGARKIDDIPQNVLELLNTGKIETVNLTEWLAVDQVLLLKNALAELNQSSWFEDIRNQVYAQKKISSNNNTKTIGLRLSELANRSTLDVLAKHQSDIVRSWACWAILHQQETLNSLISEIKTFAADHHFGLREVVIFASKERLAEDLVKSVQLLSPWTLEEDENVRRFVAEGIRPIGVWTKKIQVLQDDPSIGLPIIEPLMSDSSKYVRDAVGNWLNDASKSQPDWVLSFCKKWEKSNQTKETKYIIKRALRTINKS